MATIRLRGNKWQCRVQRQEYKEIAKSFATKEDAQRWARAIERQMDLGEYAPPEQADVTPLSALLTKYEQEVTPSKKGASQEVYRLAVLRADQIAKLIAKDLKPADIAGFRDRRLKVVKPVTVLHDLCTLSAVLEHARLEWEMAIINPVRAIRKPSIGKGRDRRLADGEGERLLIELRKARSIWIAPLFEFSIETACRRGEALALQWSDVDLAKRLATFRDTKTGDDRVIPLSSHAVKVLAELPRNLKGYVFPTPIPTIRTTFERACERAKIENLRWHDLRHEGVSRLHELGLSTVEVASISGHKTLACLARYSHMKAERLALKLG